VDRHHRPGHRQASTAQVAKAQARVPSRQARLGTLRSYGANTPPQRPGAADPGRWSSGGSRLVADDSHCNWKLQLRVARAANFQHQLDPPPWGEEEVRFTHGGSITLSEEGHRNEAAAR
jgi:hypothetical protein